MHDKYNLISVLFGKIQKEICVCIWAKVAARTNMFFFSAVFSSGRSPTKDGWVCFPNHANKELVQCSTALLLGLRSLIIGQIMRISIVIIREPLYLSVFFSEQVL